MKKLLWPEGSLLTQQHFQYAANESARNCRDNIRLLQRDLWGFIEYQTELDESFTLKSATVRLPSGDIIDVHSPLSVALPGNETAEIFLTLPLNHRVSSLAGYRDDGCQSRWKACYEDYPDEYDSTRLQELVFAEDNWSLSLEKADETKWSLKIAEVIRKQGRWESSPTFWPSVCRIGACEKMLESYERLRKKISHDIDELKQFQASLRWQVTTLLKLFVEAENDLQAIYQGYYQHPWHGFQLLKRWHLLLGCHVDNTQEHHYDHQDLAGCLQPLIRDITRQLEIVQARLPHPIELKKVEPFTYTADLDSAIRKKDFSVYLAVSNLIDNPEMTQRCSQLMTISSPTLLPQLRTRALPGLIMTPCRQFPTELFIKPGYVYFKFEPDGDHWKAICHEKSVMLYVSLEFSESEMELHVVNHDE